MYDQGGSPQAELRPAGTLCIFCMLPTEDDDVMELPVKLPVRASSQRRPETRREPQRGTETHREASASAQTVSDQKVFRCLSKYYVTRRRLSSSLSSQVSICKVICFVLFCVFSVFFLCMHVCTRVCSAPPRRGATDEISSSRWSRLLEGSKPLLDRERQLRRGNTFLSSCAKNLCNRQY